MRRGFRTWLVLAWACFCVASGARAADAGGFSLYAWGNNDAGQLGSLDGTRSLFGKVPVRCQVAAIAAGGGRTLMVGTDGSLWASGNLHCGWVGAVATTTRWTPDRILDAGVAAVAAGGGYTLIVKTDGSLWASGDNYFGQLGDGTQADRETPVRVLDSGVAAVAAGSSHTLILKTDGSLWACGWNNYGQLGEGTTTDRWTPVCVLGSGVAAVAAGAWHTLIVKTDGSLWGCGDNDGGQLGDGTGVDRPAPVCIMDSGVAAVAAGAWHTLIVKTDGSLWACGHNYRGQLGDGTTTERWRPVRVLDSGVAAVSAGGSTTLIVKAGGSLWACGDNEGGQLGNGTTTLSTTPVRVVASNVTAVAAGGGHTLVLKTDSSVWACGYSTSGALGDGLAGTCQMPARSLDAGVAAVASGYYHTLIVKTDGSAWACGGNLYGRLGDGTVDDRRDPVQVLASGVVAASAGYAHSLMVKADGSLWACGDNQYGQLGDGSLAARRRLLQSLDGGVAAAVAGERHTLIVKTDGSLWACGSNSSGQLGDGTTTARPTPVQILASGVTAVAGGNAHTLIVKTDGSLWACGSNWYGALGDGTTTDRWTPVRILASGVAAVAACLDHTLIVRTDGSLWGCGLNAWGELGDGNLVRHPTPVRILAAGVAAVATGYDHTLVLKTDGSVWTCGRNDYGQLGVGVAPQRLALTKVMTGALAVAAGASHSLALAGPDAMVVPAVVVLELDDDDAQTGSRQIVLAHRAAGEATEYQASENADFAGAEWLPYAEAPTFLLSAGGGLKTVYFRVRNAAGESLPTDDSIVLSAPPRMTVSVPGPAVSVGRTLAVTVAFSEAVTSFTARDVAVTNGTVTSFGGAEAEYRFALVPLGLGEVRLRVPAGICLDNAGYPNEGSEGVTVQCVPGSEPDDTPAQAAPLGYGMPHADSVYAAGNVDWFTFTLPATAVAYALTLETDGPAGDTLLSLYGPGNAEGLIEHDDDSGNGTFSRIRRTTWATALLPGTYYAKVEAKDGALIDAYTLALARTPFHSVNFSAAPNGRLVGSTQQVILAGDATTPVAAVPAAGYLFDRWSDGVIANPRVVANVATNLALTALFQPAAALRDGTYLATVTAAEAAAGHGLWDFTGHYEVDACGYLLSLDLLHDGRGRVSGSGSLTVASALIPLAPRGAVRGGDGVATLALSADGRPLPPGPPAAAALRLTLGLDPAARALAGPAALRLRTGAAPAITSEPCTLALSAPMDGSFVLRLDLACAGPSVRGTAELRLSNGVAYPLVVRRGHAKGGAALLTLAGDQAQPAARGLHFTLTVTPLEGGTARIDALTAQALGMALAW